LTVLEVDSHLFPIPDSQYALPEAHFSQVGLSIFALHIELVNHPGNQLDEKKHEYLFVESSVPYPRPATLLAWHRIVRLGNQRSTQFIVPFLPSLREEDEVGQAISLRGVRIPSLSRKSGLHRKNPKGGIIWGPVLFGDLNPSATIDSILTSKSIRSNFVEALCVRRGNHDARSAQESIRARMEFLASHGFIATRRAATLAGLPQIERLLFRFASGDSAVNWALAYNTVYFRVMSDPGCVVSDYKDMIHDLKLARLSRDAQKEQKVNDSGNKISSSGRFGEIDIGF
jgi:hypothetical protein